MQGDREHIGSGRLGNRVAVARRREERNGGDAVGNLRGNRVGGSRGDLRRVSKSTPGVVQICRLLFDDLVQSWVLGGVGVHVEKRAVHLLLARDDFRLGLLDEVGYVKGFLGRGVRKDGLELRNAVLLVGDGSTELSDLSRGPLEVCSLPLELSCKRVDLRRHVVHLRALCVDHPVSFGHLLGAALNQLFQDDVLRPHQLGVFRIPVCAFECIRASSVIVRQGPDKVVDRVVVCDGEMFLDCRSCLGVVRDDLSEDRRDIVGGGKSKMDAHKTPDILVVPGISLHCSMRMLVWVGGPAQG